jgi:hypothetical protein
MAVSQSVCDWEHTVPPLVAEPRTRLWVPGIGGPAAELLSFLKQMHGPWTERDLSKALNISSAEAKQEINNDKTADYIISEAVGFGNLPLQFAFHSRLSISLGIG